MRPLGLVEGLFVRGLGVPHLHTSSSPSRRYHVEGLRCWRAATCGHGPGRKPLGARAPGALEVTLTFVTETRSEPRHWGAHLAAPQKRHERLWAAKPHPATTATTTSAAQIAGCAHIGRSSFLTSGSRAVLMATTMFPSSSLCPSRRRARKARSRPSDPCRVLG